MKALALATILFALSTTSCKKTYNCHCSNHLNAYDNTNTEIKAKTRDAAIKECETNSLSWVCTLQ